MNIALDNHYVWVSTIHNLLLRYFYEKIIEIIIEVNRNRRVFVKISKEYM